MPWTPRGRASPTRSATPRVLSRRSTRRRPLCSAGRPPASSVVPLSSSYTPTMLETRSTNGSRCARTAELAARDAVGNWGNWSSVRSFTIDTLAPAAPALVAPLDGTITADNMPVFSWSSVTGAVSYRLMVDTSGGFSSLGCPHSVGTCQVPSQRSDTRAHTPTSGNRGGRIVGSFNRSRMVSSGRHGRRHHAAPRGRGPELSVLRASDAHDERLDR